MLKCVSWIFVAVLLCHVLPVQAQSEKGTRLANLEPDLGLLNLKVKWDDSLPDLVSKCRMAAGESASVKLDEIDLQEAKTAEDLYRLIAQTEGADTTRYNQIALPICESLAEISISPISMPAVKGVSFEVTLSLNSSPGYFVLHPEKCRLTDKAEFLTPCYLESIRIEIVHDKENAHAFGNGWRDYMKAVDKVVRPTGARIEWLRSGEGLKINYEEDPRKLFTMGLWDLDSNGNPEVMGFRFQHRGPHHEETLEQAYRRMVKQRLVR